jgi:anthranilate phosphoribosyltransferase
MALGQPEELVSRSIEDNVAMCREVLEGRSGARRNIVLLNSAAGLIAAGRVDDFPRGSPSPPSPLTAGGHGMFWTG